MDSRTRRLTSRSGAAFFLLAGIVLILSMTGCATVGKMPSANSEPALKSADSGRAWWYARFQMNWSQREEDEPAWHNDLLIAHKVIAPVLEWFGKDIDLWRFHRRAAPDDGGHQFSFIFYSSPATAKKIYTAIQASALLEEMQKAGVILRVLYDDPDKPTRPLIESTSDPHWSEPLQRAWPWFIMGVSETWLDLISQYAEEREQTRKPATPAEFEEFYLEINKKVDATWNREGGHAFLHHLDALFGYRPVSIGKQQIRF